MEALSMVNNLNAIFLVGTSVGAAFGSFYEFFQTGILTIGNAICFIFLLLSALHSSYKTIEIPSWSIYLRNNEFSLNFLKKIYSNDFFFWVVRIHNNIIV